MTRRRHSIPLEDLGFRIADLFFRRKKTATQIAEELDISREAVYPALAQLRDSHSVSYFPPLKVVMMEEFAQRFSLDEDEITIVGTDSIPNLEKDKPDLNGHRIHIAGVVADLALKLIKRVSRSKKPGEYIGIGLGPGSSTMEVARQLGYLMKSQLSMPKLRLVTISSACPAKHPQYSSTAFLNLFPNSVVAEQIGLFAEPLVSSDDFKSLHMRPGVKDAFYAKPDVDVIISGMGDWHEHDFLRMLLMEVDGGVEALDRKQMVGNVMYRPYSATGPIIEEGNEQRAVTLFELDDFVRMSDSKNKHVILIAKPCGRDTCMKSKADALLPLLTNKKLRVWSKLVMDFQTANDILNMNTTA